MAAEVFCTDSKMRNVLFVVSAEFKVRQELSAEKSHNCLHYVSRQGLSGWVILGPLIIVFFSVILFVVAENTKTKHKTSVRCSVSDNNGREIYR